MKIEAIDLLAGKTWACELGYIRAVRDVFQKHDAGVRLDFLIDSNSPTMQARHELMTAFEGSQLDGMDATLHTSGNKNVAVLPLRGGLFPRANMATNHSGATSLSSWSSDFQKLLYSSDVQKILIPIDSPGGVIDGVGDTHAMLMGARDIKPVIGYAEGNCCSAAIWIGSGASKLYANPTARLGSIGVATTVIDDSKAADTAGLRMIDIVSKNAPLKRGGANDEAYMADLQKQLDQIEDIMIGNIASGRGTSTKDVRENFGRGGVRIGKDALAHGMADGVMTLNEMMSLMLM